MPAPTLRLAAWTEGAAPADPAEWPALMARAQAGDNAAYRRLLTAVAPWLRGVVRRVLGHAADTEDAVQDILLTLHSVRHTYDPARPFRPWLAGIARHRLADRLRARGRILANELPLPDDFDPPAPEAQPLAGIDRRALRAGLEALPAGQRQAITLLKLQDMSLREASAASGQSIAALKVATHRGLKALRRRFAGTQADPAAPELPETTP